MKLLTATPLTFARAPRGGDEPARRPHVMHVVLSLTAGGTEHLVIEMCRRMRSDYDVSVCCLDDEGVWAERVRTLGVEVIAMRRRGGFRPGVGRQLAALAAARQVDLLHCHQYSPFVYGRLAIMHQRGLGLVYTEHGRLSDAAPSWRRRAVNPVLGRFGGAIVAVSDELRRYMSTAGFPLRRIHVIHNGIAIDAAGMPDDRERARRALDLPADVFTVATVARLDVVKDLTTLVAAFALLRGAMPRVRLVIIGEGPEREALERAATTAGVRDDVLFGGFRSDVRALLPAFDVFVNSSISEGISVTLLEAMAAGVPIVATRVGGTPEILCHDESALLVPAREPSRLAAAIGALARDPARARALADAARQRVSIGFTLDRMVAEYGALYEDTLHTATQRRPLTRSIQ
jgi:L-malate glycosyltransferase